MKAFYDWHKKNMKETNDPYPPTQWELNAFRAGMIEAAEIADEHTCEMCSAYGTSCEEGIAEDIRKSAESKCDE